MQIRYSLPALMIMLMLSVCAHAQDASEQDSTGLPGDNFSLQGALEMFKKSASPEAFEKALNSEDNKVNNLDLNGDGQIDYIRVVNKKEDDVQVFVLQAVISEGENQDVAVIELQKTGDENAVIQIEGDRDIYGETKIAEPAAEGEGETSFNYTPATHGPSASSPDILIVNVWFWPCVRYVYAPAYVVWVSPWTWHARPMWWHPWRPMPWYSYRPYYYRYHAHYAYAPVRRIAPARVIYRPMRTSSMTVINRNRVVVNNYRVNNRSSYQPSRTNGGYNNGGRNYQPSRSYDNGGRTYQPSRSSQGQPGRSYQSQPGRGGYQSQPGRSYQSQPNRSFQRPGSNAGGRSSGGGFNRSGGGGGGNRSGGRSRG